MTAGRVYLSAGNGGFGVAGMGGPALKAAVTATYLAVDHHGNVVIADNPDSCVAIVAARTGTFFGRRMTAGHISRLSRGAPVGKPGRVPADPAPPLILPTQPPPPPPPTTPPTGPF